MEPLLRRWPDLVKQAHRRPMMLLMDYDGTLTPIAATPGRAVLSSKRRAVLQRISRLPGVFVGIISGRSLWDIEARAGLTRVAFAGNHGLESRYLGRTWVHPQAKAFRPVLKKWAGSLRSTLSGIPGAWVEEKELTLSVHWRALLPRWQPIFHERIKELTKEAIRQKKIRLTKGRRVLELRPPVNWNKGHAVEWWLRHLSARGKGQRPLVIYLGDDQTDEDAFRVVNRLGGWSVFVGAKPQRTTLAHFWLRGPTEVFLWLRALHRYRQGLSGRTGRT